MAGTQTFGHRPVMHRFTVYNSDIVQLNSGEPVCLVMDGVNDGNDAVKPSTVATAALAHAGFLGIALANIGVGEYGDICVYGFVKECKVIKQSRAASTNSYNSFSAGVLGDELQLDPVNNGLFHPGTPAAAADFLNYAVLMETFASGASSASTTSDSSVIVSDTLQVWIRSM